MACDSVEQRRWDALDGRLIKYAMHLVRPPGTQEPYVSAPNHPESSAPLA